MKIFSFFYKLFKNETAPSEIESRAISETIEVGLAKKKRVNSNVWGEFELKGFYYISDDDKIKIRRGSKNGDPITLVPDPSNQHDPHVIKAFHNGMFTGWVPDAYPKQEKLFNVLQTGKEVKATLIDKWKLRVRYEYQK